MNTRAPRPHQLIGLGLFILSCFALTLYLWNAFGGTAPLQAKGYRMVVPFADAGGLTVQADVRIAGVDVGKVVAKRLDAKRRLTYAELDLDTKYGPRPADTKAILRQKTVLGETYVQLSAGTPGSPMLPDGGTLAPAQVLRTSHIDDLLRTFDPATRKALAAWLTGQGAALQDGGPALSAALAQLAPLGVHGRDVLAILDRQGRDLSALLDRGATAVAALSARRGALGGLVRNTARVVDVTAARQAQLAGTVQALPAFLRSTRATIDRAARFSRSAVPLVRQLRPAARELAPVLRDANTVAPDLQTVFTGLGPLERAARPGLPALQHVLDDSTPLLRRLTPYLGTLVPAVGHLASYRRELAALFANVAAATQATLPAGDGSGPLHYVRGSLPINPEALAAYPQRLPTNRSNAYPAPGSYSSLLSGLTVGSGVACGAGTLPVLGDLTAELLPIVQDAYFTAVPDGPPCRASAAAAGSAVPVLRPLP